MFCLHTLANSLKADRYNWRIVLERIREQRINNTLFTLNRL